MKKQQALAAYLMVTGLLLFAITLVPLFWPSTAHPHLLYVWGLVAATAFISYRINQKAEDITSDSSYMYYMAGMGIRLLSSMTGIAVYVFRMEPERDELTTVMIWFFLCYFSYSIAEVKSILSNLRRRS